MAKLIKVCALIIALSFPVYSWGASYNFGPGETYETLSALLSGVGLSAGDIADGGNNTIRETVTISAANATDGTAENRITIRNVKLIASDQYTSTWTAAGDEYYIEVAEVGHGVTHVVGDPITGTLTKFTLGSGVGTLSNNQWYHDAVPTPDRLYIKMASAPDNETFEISYGVVDGILINAIDYVTLDNATIYYASDQGVELLNAESAWIKNSKISYNCNDGIHGTGAATNALIENNAIKWNGEDRNNGATTGKGDGISFHDTGTGIIRRNIFDENFKGAVLNTNTASFEVYGNYMSNNRYGASVAGSAVDNFYGNIIVLDPSNQYEYGIFVSNGYAGTAKFVKNTIYGNGTPGAANYGIQVWDGTVTLKNNIVLNTFFGIYEHTGFVGTLDEDYNCVDTSNSTYVNIVKGSNSIEQDPLLENASGGNFRLQDASPARGSGIPVSGIDRGYDGNFIASSDEIDMGAIHRVVRPSAKAIVGGTISEGSW